VTGVDVTAGKTDLFDRLAIVMAHPDDEVLWACSALRAAEKIVLVFGELGDGPQLTEGRREAMSAFPLPTLEWLEMVEAGGFDSASWRHPKETEYGLYLHPTLRLLRCFDPDRYCKQFSQLQDRLRISLKGMKNVIAHGPWGEYGHEDHVQVFRAVAGLAGEMGFRVWVPAYVAPKSELLMRRNLRYFGRPSAALPIDRALAEEISKIYMRTNTWTWFDSYVWPESERFLPWAPGGGADVATESDVQRIVFPAEFEATRRKQLNWKRELKRKALSWFNGRRAD
jgi:LmbE family N-acetylglucosaminyl deacetylase